MPKKELTLEQKVDEALEWVNKAMKENIIASRLETNAKLRKQQAYHKLMDAKKYLNSIEKELMEEI